MIAAPRPRVSVSNSVLYVAFELGKRQWKLAMTSGFGVAPVIRTVPAGNWGAVQGALAWSRARLGVAAEAAVYSCYEAGRDGFWIHRMLVAQGIANRVVDSASIDVNRRARRTKTDRVDALKLVMKLVRVVLGETRVWSEVRVPSEADEAGRHVSRERHSLTREQTRLTNQMRSWLATWGAALPRRRDADWWTRVVDGRGRTLPAEIQARLGRAWARRQLIAQQIDALDAVQATAIQTAAATSAAQQLVRLKGISVTSASMLLDEGLLWRQFTNRRQLGGLLGFAPTTYASGELQRPQGISRAGNDRLQSLMVQLAWSWVHWQPTSALSRWYQARFGTGQRARKIGIVALARKLLIALWRWATHQVLPAGAVLKLG